MEIAAWLEKKTVLPSADPDQQMLEQKEQGKEGMSFSFQPTDVTEFQPVFSSDRVCFPESFT